MTTYGATFQISASELPFFQRRAPSLSPTADVPEHAHYTLGTVVLLIGITGVIGNSLVIYAFSNRSLRTPANMFIINMALADLLMCVTQTPTFFINSMHRRWIFGEKACEVYAFCGALFGICSMLTLTLVAADRFFVITRPLASIGMLSRRRAGLVLMGAWLYSLAWSLPPFFGWSAYVPEGLMTSCSWDYMTFSPGVRAYTMLLFIFVFFIPLFIIIYCYYFIFRSSVFMFRAVGRVNGSCSSRGSRGGGGQRLQTEWKTAKIALILILLYVLSWAPYSGVALTAFAGYADMVTPYMNSVPAVIAKASAIHNPIIYAITHPKYRYTHTLTHVHALTLKRTCTHTPSTVTNTHSHMRTCTQTITHAHTPAAMQRCEADCDPTFRSTFKGFSFALSRYIPCLGRLLCVPPADLRSAGSSFSSTRRSTLSSQTSGGSARQHSARKSRLSSASDSESVRQDGEGCSGRSATPTTRQARGGSRVRGAGGSGV
uniref:Opsin 4 n=1 Tax=Gadus morhua TaxID=8049 RepID=A0A8C5BBG8_GADMO